MLTIHHLGISQSERIVWLCEELGLDYKLVTHTRDPLGSPATLKSLPGNATGKAPFIEDSEAGVTLSESGAIAEYIIQRHGRGKLAIHPDADAAGYAEYLHWFHFSNSTLQLMITCSMFLDFTGISGDTMVKQMSDQRLEATLRVVDDRLADNKWLAGNGDGSFTAADVMTVFSVTTQRYFGPSMNLGPYPNILRWLGDCAARPAYQRAMQKGDPEMRLLLDAEPPEPNLFVAGGAVSDVWKKNYKATAA